MGTRLYEVGISADKQMTIIQAFAVMRRDHEQRGLDLGTLKFEVSA